jgi:hypothetical protein
LPLLELAEGVVSKFRQCSNIDGPAATIMKKLQAYKSHLQQLMRTHGISFGIARSSAVDPLFDPNSYLPLTFEKENLRPITFFLALGGDYKFAREVKFV